MPGRVCRQARFTCLRIGGLAALPTLLAMLWIQAFGHLPASAVIPMVNIPTFVDTRYYVCGVNGAVVSGSVEIVNRSDSQVLLGSVQAGCDCVSTSLDSHAIDSGGVTICRYTIATHDLPGRRSNSVRILRSDGTVFAICRIYTVGVMPVEFLSSRQSISFGLLSPQEEVSRSIALRVHRPQDSFATNQVQASVDAVALTPSLTLTAHEPESLGSTVVSQVIHLSLTATAPDKLGPGETPCTIRLLIGGTPLEFSTVLSWNVVE